MAAPGSSVPRVRVAALITIEGRIVLVRHRKNDRAYHLLPGGGVGYRETLVEALTREVAEETGLECSLARPLILSDTIDPDGDRHVVNIVFECTPTGGAITDTPADDRVEAVELVDPADLTSLDLRPPIARLLVSALEQGAGFQATYAGSLFTGERV